MSEGPAEAYARSASAWTDVDWWRLESRAFTGEPRVKQSLAFFAPTTAWKDLASEAPALLGCLMMPAHIACLAFPALAMFLLIGWMIGRAPVSILATAGAMAAFAGLWLVLSMFLDSRRPDGRTVNGARQISFLHVVPSAITALLTFTAFGAGAGFAIVGLLGALLDLGVGIVALRFYRPAATDWESTMEMNERRLQRALAAVPDARRSAIQQDLGGALSVLASGGLIGAGEAQAARDVPFGRLAITFAPREETRPADWRRPGS